MKFVLEPYKRKMSKSSKEVPDLELIQDIIRVAKHLERDTITKSEYNKLGRYSTHAIHNRFDGWVNALKVAKLSPSRSKLDISDQDLLNDLLLVAKNIDKKSLTRDEYKKCGKYGLSTFQKHFGSWFKALESVGLKKTRTLGVTREEYFKNLEEVWIKLGRQPRYSEMGKPLSQFSAAAYEYRFGSWRKALESFITYVNNAENEIIKPKIDDHKSDSVENKSPSEVKFRKTQRQVSDRLRFLILRRDNYTCRLCGISPAIKPGTELVIDHIIPWAKGGETIYDNLQTLCRVCNGGKGDLGQSE